MPSNQDVELIVSNPAVGQPVLSPFDHFKVRSFIWPAPAIVAYAFVAGVLMAGAELQLFLLVAGLGTYTIVLTWMVWECREHSIAISRLIGPQTVGYDCLTGLAGLAGLWAFSGGTIWLRSLLYHRTPSDWVHTRNWLIGAPALDPRWSWPLILCTVAFLAILVPAVEEFWFRGLLLHRWARKWGPSAGILVSSAGFALLHSDLVHAFVFALVLAVLYIRTRMLWMPVGVHALYNLLCCAESLGFIKPLFGPLWAAIGGLPLLWIIAWLWPRVDRRLPYEVNRPGLLVSRPMNFEG